MTEIRRLIQEIEAAQFIKSALAFIEEQADRFHTNEEWIEDLILELIILIKNERIKEKNEVE